MKTNFTELLSHYQDDTIKIREKSVADSKNVLKLTGVTTKKHITMTKRAVSWSIGIAVATLSCFTVYAVESGTLSNFIKYYNRNRYTPYSYSGTYNQTVDSETYINENINTNVVAQNVQCDNDDVSISIQGVICDINLVQVVANISVPNGKSLVDNTYAGDIVWFRDFSVTSKSGETISPDDCFITILPTKDVDENTIPISINFHLSDMKSADGAYNINIGNLTRDYEKSHDGLNSLYDTEILVDCNLNFDIDTTGCDVSKKMYNVNKVISTPEGDITIDSIYYSPMSFCMNFTTPFKSKYANIDELLEFESDRSGMSYSYKSDEYTTLNSTLNLDALKSYFTMYFIYSDGSKVLASRDARSLMFNDSFEVTNVLYDYYSANIDMVDYTNVVSVEINGTVIPLQ